MNQDNKIRVGLVQIGNSFSGQAYFPYTAGVLQSFCKRHLNEPEAFEFLPIIFLRDSLDSCVEELRGSDIVLFSCYPWNLQFSLALASKLKNISPDTIMCFGGPSIPIREEACHTFLTENPFVDIACLGEGEQTTVSILEALKAGEQISVQGTATHDTNAGFSHISGHNRMENLDNIPSPYLDGVFDSLISKHPEIEWLGLLETNRGCPFGCSYCSWGRRGDANKIAPFHMDRIKAELDWMSENEVSFIFCCDANFGILERDYDVVMHVVELKKKTGFPHAFSVQNTKNMAEKTFLVEKTLSDNQLSKGANLAVQTITREALVNIGRKNIPMEHFAKLQTMYRSHGIATYTDLILGLPGETKDSFINSACTLIESGQHFRIQFNNLIALSNAPMSAPGPMKEHEIQTATGRLINVHGQRNVDDGTPDELQDLVVGTKTMPIEDWRESRVFGWLVELLYFNKLFQLPIFMAANHFGADYRNLFSSLLSKNLGQWPILQELVEFLRERADQLSKGGDEYCLSDQWLPIWWPVGEFLYIKLIKEDKLDEFSRQAADFFSGLTKNPEESHPIIKECADLNKKLLILPTTLKDTEWEGTYDYWSYFMDNTTGSKTDLSLMRGKYILRRSQHVFDNNNKFDEWCRTVVWYRHRTGAYYYDLERKQ